MDNKELDKLIRKLKDYPNSNTNYKDAWDIIKTIGKSFKGVRYPTPEEKNVAWNQFQSSVDRIKKSQDEYRKKREERVVNSSRYKNEIVSRALSARPPSGLEEAFGSVLLFPVNIASAVADAVLPGPPSDDTKKMLENCSGQLRKAWDLFKSYKDDMLGKDKNEAYQTLKRIEEQINDAWERWRDLKTRAHKARQEAWQRERERRNAEYQRKQNEWRERMRGKIYKMEQLIRDKYNYIGRLESQIDDLRSKRYDARSDSFRSRVDGWIDEKRDKISDVRYQIREIESKISSIRSKL